MTCRSCGAALQPDARFCPACGAATAVACGACGAALPAGARFCPSCGAPADGTASPGSTSGEPEPSRRERKIATLLFADLVGFTTLGESHDPELVGSLVGRAFERLAAEVARYEGTLEKFAGDALLAVFGVPTVHEDDAERAVRAALEMQAAIAELSASFRAEGRPELRLRIGLEGGEILVDLARASGQRDLFVTGDAVNTAARLQQIAAPGSVVVGPSVYAATRDLVEYEELPPAQLKGKSLAVAAWRAVAVKARRGGQRAPLGLEAPLVGRDEELALLKETVRRTVTDGRPHLVTVLGAAGVGKSRLTWELEKYLDGLPDVYTWRKGRCLAYAQVSYSALADVAKADARIRDDDAPASADTKLGERLAELGGGQAEREALRSLLAIRIGDLGRDELFEGWRHWLEAIAARAPLVLVLEDLHWADDGLLDVVEFLARWAQGPILLLVLARHELLERRPTWGGGLPNATALVLEPLAPAESSALVDGLVGSALPTGLRDRVVALADGNPLFAEELIRMFVDRGVLRHTDGGWQLASPIEELEVPGTVQAVLAARLDALPASEKLLAQHASVVGRIFWDAVVAHLSRQGVPATGDLLRRLRVKELVVPREPSSLAGASEFGFRHVLIRDVAYDSLPKRDRASLHLDVARWAETDLADRIDETIELVASHYLAALRFEEEFGTDEARLGNIREETYRYARRAGARATALHQLGNASRWLSLAVEEARRLDLPSRERAALAEELFLGSVGHLPLEQILATVSEAIVLLAGVTDRAADDEQLLGRLRVNAGLLLFEIDRVEEARELLERGIRELDAGPPTHARAALLARLGWTYWRAGPVADAIPILRRAIDECRAAAAPDIERWALHELAVATSALGESGEDLPLVLESFRLAREANDKLLLGRCYNNVSSIMAGHGLRWEEIRPILLEGIDVMRRSANLGSLNWLAQNMAEGLVQRGDVDAAIPYLEEAIAAAHGVSDPIRELILRSDLAEIRFLQGDPGAAAEIDERYAELARYHSEPQTDVWFAFWKAQRRWQTDPDAAVQILEHAVSTSRHAGTRLDGGRRLARLAWRTGAAGALATAAEAVIAVTAPLAGPLRALDRRWVAALTRPPREAVAELEPVAGEFEALGYRLPAADVLADAAIAAARAGLDAGDLVERATGLYAACGVVPILGRLPETRWIGTPRAVAEPA